MPTTLTSREFEQAAGRARQAAEAGPVFITERGRPAHVLISIEEYRRLSRTSRNLADSLSHAGSADIAFDPPKMGQIALKDAEFD